MKTEITMQHLYNVCEVVLHPTASAFPVRGPHAPAAVPVVSQPVAVTTLQICVSSKENVCIWECPFSLTITQNLYICEDTD